MGLRDRILASQAEERVIGGVPWRPWDSPYWRFNIGGPIHPSRQVMGADKSLGLPALYAGAKLLADNAASLPIKIVMTDDDTGRETQWRGPSLFDKPSSVGTTFDWIQTCMMSLVLHGNAWGLITDRDSYGYPTNIEWQPPDYITVEEDEYQPYNPQKTRVYLYGRNVPRDQLLHIKAVPLPGRFEGISVIRQFGMTILSGMKAQEYGVEFYEAGGFPVGVFQNTEIEIDRQQASQIREFLVETLRNRTPLVYGRDWDYKAVTVPPNEAQFIETIQMNAGQIAAILNLPPDRIGGTRGDSLTYNTTEQSTLQVIEALRPWLCRLESAFFDILPRRRKMRFDTDALLKTDLKTRMDIFQVARNIGALTVDEIRQDMGREPLPGGIGSEPMPLVLMNAMATRAGGIPKTLMPQIVLEMDLAAKRLEALEKKGIAKPDAPLPLAQDAASFLAGLVNVQRDGGEAGFEAGRYLEKIEERLSRIESSREVTPIGPWIPRDTAGELEESRDNSEGVPGLSDNDGMIGLHVPDGTLPRADGGTANHHITLVYLGKNVSDEDFERASQRAKDAAASVPGPVTAKIGGSVGSFEPSGSNGGKRPDYAQVDMDDKGYQLRHKLADLSKSQHTEWNPHVTLKYSRPDEPVPSATDAKLVKFRHVYVKRGADIVRFPIGSSEDDPATGDVQ